MECNIYGENAMSIEMIKLNPPERARTYQFPSGKVELAGITEFCARPSGTHRLRTADGKLHIIPVGWIHVEIDADEWTL